MQWLRVHKTNNSSLSRELYAFIRFGLYDISKQIYQQGSSCTQCPWQPQVRYSMIHWISLGISIRLLVVKLFTYCLGTTRKKLSYLFQNNMIYTVRDNCNKFVRCTFVPFQGQWPCACVDIFIGSNDSHFHTEKIIIKSKCFHQFMINTKNKLKLPIYQCKLEWHFLISYMQNFTPLKPTSTVGTMNKFISFLLR